MLDWFSSIFRTKESPQGLKIEQQVRTSLQRDIQANGPFNASAKQKREAPSAPQGLRGRPSKRLKSAAIDLTGSQDSVHVDLTDDDEESSVEIVQVLSAQLAKLKSDLARSPQGFFPKLVLDANGLHFEGRSNTAKHNLLTHYLCQTTDIAAERLALTGRPTDRWLDDNIIARFSQKMTELYPSLGFVDSLIMSYSQEKFTKHIQSARASQRYQRELSQKSRIAFAYHENGHWHVLLAFVSADKQRIQVIGMDSFNTLTVEHDVFKKATGLLNTVFVDASIETSVAKLPVQSYRSKSNIYDCGVSACAMIETFAKGELTTENLQRLASQAMFNYGPYRSKILAVLGTESKHLHKLR